MYAGTSYKQYIPQEFRHYIPDVSCDDTDDCESVWFADEDLDDGDTNKASVASYGPRHYVNKKFDDLKVHGPTTLDKVTVDGKTLIYGPLSGHELQTKYLNVQGPVNITGLKAEMIEVNGPVHLKSAHINGDVVINGPLMAHASIFEGKIDITTNKMKLIDTKVTTLHIRKNSDSPLKVQKVFLRGKTVVKDISFEKEGGAVIVRKPAIVEGNVKGGKIIFKD